jgi:hypothetical protein
VPRLKPLEMVMKSLKKALGSQGGFAFLLSGLKAFLEHKIVLNLSADHAPDHIKTHQEELKGS